MKRFESGMVVNPVTVQPQQTLAEVRAIMAHNRISGLPVVEPVTQRLVGILTNRDVRFATDPGARVEELMTRDNLITVTDGATPDLARQLLHKNRIEKLLVVDEPGPLHRHHHRQGHGEGGRPSARQQGRDGPAALRRRHRRRRGRLPARPRR